MNSNADEFEKLAKLSDEGKWQYLLEHKPQWCTVYLDNDYTFIGLDDDEDADTIGFDGYIGWSDGVLSLLTVLGIKHEPV